TNLYIRQRFSETDLVRRNANQARMKVIIERFVLRRLDHIHVAEAKTGDDLELCASVKRCNGSPQESFERLLVPYVCAGGKCQSVFGEDYPPRCLHVEELPARPDDFLTCRLRVGTKVPRDLVDFALAVTGEAVAPELVLDIRDEPIHEKNRGEPHLAEYDNERRPGEKQWRKRASHSKLYSESYTN